MPLMHVNPAVPGKRGPKRRYQPAILEILKWGAARPVDIYRAMGLPLDDALSWKSTQMNYLILYLRAMEKCGFLKCTRCPGNRGNYAYYQLPEDNEPCLLPTLAAHKARVAAKRKATREAWHRSHPEPTAGQRAAAMSLAAAWPEP